MKHLMLFSIFILIISLSGYSQDNPIVENQTSYSSTSANNYTEEPSFSTIKRTFYIVRFEKESTENRLKEWMFTNDIKLSNSQIAKFNIDKVVFKVQPFDFSNSLTYNYNTGISISFDILNIFK